MGSRDGGRHGANDAGKASLNLPSSGSYKITVTKDGYEPSSENINAGGENIEATFTLVPKIRHAESVEVRDVATTVDQGATTFSTISAAELKLTPGRAASVRDALPLVPGVVRTPEGKLIISDASEHRSSLLVSEVAAKLGRTVASCCEQIYAPVGLDLGGDGPEAIALAVIAEAQACCMGKLGDSRRLSAEDVARGAQAQGQ